MGYEIIKKDWNLEKQQPHLLELIVCPVNVVGKFLASFESMDQFLAAILASVPLAFECGRLT